MQRRVFAILAAGLLPALSPTTALAAPPRAAETADSAAESRAALRALVTANAAPSAAGPPGPAAERGTATETARLPPPCTRKVKVVYAGYGEAERAVCSASPSPRGGG